MVSSSLLINIPDLCKFGEKHEDYKLGTWHDGEGAPGKICFVGNVLPYSAVMFLIDRWGKITSEAVCPMAQCDHRVS